MYLTLNKLSYLIYLIHYGLNPKKRGEFVKCESQTEKEPRNGKWQATFHLVRTNRNERTTSKRTPQFSVGISEK